MQPQTATTHTEDAVERTRAAYTRALLHLGTAQERGEHVALALREVEEARKAFDRALDEYANGVKAS